MHWSEHRTIYQIFECPQCGCFKCVNVWKMVLLHLFFYCLQICHCCWTTWKCCAFFVQSDVSLIAFLFRFVYTKATSSPSPPSKTHLVLWACFVWQYSSLTNGTSSSGNRFFTRRFSSITSRYSPFVPDSIFTEVLPSNRVAHPSHNGDSLPRLTGAVHSTLARSIPKKRYRSR